MCCANRFGPYLLLQTLGEGEFGKVKLGLHAQWGEEVAVKLIRRGSIDSDARMSKVEREIEVLRTLKHPHIVRLYDVIETDKYIGIILEYASGGELFDHILASRYLRERDAAKLFAQLLSGVWYIHQKRIVHRDLKLENLLLDKGRNVIITDFGFANRFGSAPRRGEENPAQAYGDADAFSVAPDLMQTSCGSPCYAAPELVVSEGLYVGSAVDVWSCGVILYAMLAGYLPFDDDPANPDGDNINLLYKYIVSTPLAYPDYVSDAARGILSLMLQPDPRRRASLEKVMRHPWLDAFWEEGSGGKRGKGTAIYVLSPPIDVFFRQERTTLTRQREACRHRIWADGRRPGEGGNVAAPGQAAGVPAPDARARGAEGEGERRRNVQSWIE
ncbi:Pkinase-domain-containing protein [Schizophyllum commune H4-8]|uniref:Protein kinase domain-containing protein n=1 Tax=Schizophyllum commune (strain H4-8 / FGSC 9210) TaxID=578458 RepID=D8QG75_SCHCM|nr:Pkinase-domain-containing protein [Schizophyllum commune H4-8]KAI5887939.1 Pkinase-domain-containing protein [Schizophyllum commune H4-8]